MAKSLKQRVKAGDLRIDDRGPLLFTASSFAHYGLRAMLGQRVSRNTDQVMGEYNREERTEHWKRDLAVDDLIFGDDRAEQWIVRDFELARGTVREAREYLLERLAHNVKETLPDGEGTVVEFGCGTGRNLFFLAQRFPRLKLIGIELTPKTVERARIVARDHDWNIEFHVGDMTAPPDLQTEVDMAYSVHALEQLPRAYTQAADAMLTLANQTVLFLEPIHELFPKTMLGLAARFRIYNADYLNGLMRHLKASGARIRHAKLLPTAGYPLNWTGEVCVGAKG
ncbi:MAG: methyltransferase domain-containing protein [Myxococcota bacterium]